MFVNLYNRLKNNFEEVNAQSGVLESSPHYVPTSESCHQTATCSNMPRSGCVLCYENFHTHRLPYCLSQTTNERFDCFLSFPVNITRAREWLNVIANFVVSAFSICWYKQA